MQTALKQTTIASVTRFPTKLTSDKAFLIFLSNLYYKLECNDLAFQDLLTNPKSNVVYLNISHFGSRVEVGAREVKLQLQEFAKTLTFDQCNRLYKEFLTKNNIKKVA